MHSNNIVLLFLSVNLNFAYRQSKVENRVYSVILKNLNKCITLSRFYFFRKIPPHEKVPIQGMKNPEIKKNP